MAPDQKTLEQIDGALERNRQARIEAIRANSHLLEADQKWSVDGEMGLAAAFFYLRLTGDFKLSDGRTLKFQGDLGGLGVAGGTFWGKATFDVDLDELVNGSVFVEVTGTGIVGGGMQASFWRNGKYLGAFIGAGVSIFSQAGAGSGHFSVS